MALSVKNSAKGTSQNATSVSISPPAPTNGNLLLFCVGYYPGSPTSRTASPPTGWTQLFDYLASSVRITIFYKIANSEGSTPTYTSNISGGTDDQGATYYEIQGQDVIQPFNQAAQVKDNTSGNSTSVPTATETPTILGCLALAFGTQDTGSANTDTVSSGWTLDQSARPGTFHATDEASKNVLTSDLTTGISATFTMPSSISLGVLLLINPAGTSSKQITMPMKPVNPIINWNHKLTKNLVLDVPVLEKGMGNTGLNMVDLVNRPGVGVVNGALSIKRTPVGPAISFNGTNQFMRYSYIAKQAPTSKITLEVVLFKSDWDSDNTHQMFHSKTQGGGYTLELNEPGQGNNTIVFVIRANGIYNFLPWIAASLANNIPHIIHGVYDGVKQYIYVDGILRASQALTGAIQYGVSNGLALGSDPDSGSPPLSEGSYIQPNTQVVSFRMWGERALNPTEIKYQAQNPWQFYVEPIKLFFQSTGAVQNTKTFTIDGIVLAKTTKTFTIDAIVKTKVTKTWTIDAIVLAKTTKTFTIDAVVKAKTTKTFTVDGIVLVKNTKTFTIDALVKAKTTKTWTIDAVVKAKTTETWTIDGIVKAKNTKTFTIDAIVLVKNTKTFTIDGIVLAKTTKTWTVDAVVKAKTTKTFTIDGIILTKTVKTWTIDAIVLAKTTKTFTIDALVDSKTVKTFTIDAIVKAKTTKTFTIDAIVLNKVSKTFTVDALVKAKTVKTFTIDGVVLVKATKTFTIDTVVLAKTTKTWTIDGIVLVKNTKTFTVDAVVETMPIKTFTVDGIVLVKTTKTWTVDGIVLTKVIKTFSIDGIIKAKTTKTFTVDAIVLTKIQKTWTVDAVIKVISTKQYTIDGIVLTKNTLTFTVDGIIRVVLTKTFTIDALVSGANKITFTTDGIVKVVGSIQFTVDAIIAWTKYSTPGGVIKVGLYDEYEQPKSFYNQISPLHSPAETPRLVNKELEFLDPFTY